MIRITPRSSVSESCLAGNSFARKSSTISSSFAQLASMVAWVNFHCRWWRITSSNSRPGPCRSALCCRRWCLRQLGAGFLKLIATMLMPSMAPAWATMATLPAALLRKAKALAAHLPMADVPIAQPPVWAILLFLSAGLSAAFTRQWTADPFQLSLRAGGRVRALAVHALAAGLC